MICLRSPVADRPPHLRLRALRRALVLVWLTSMPLASSATTPALLALSVVPGDREALQLRVRMQGGAESDLHWSTNTVAGSYRLILAWSGALVRSDQAELALPMEAPGPVTDLALDNTQDQTRLVLQLSRSIQPHLRRSGDSWLLRLDPDPRASPAAVASAAGAPAPLITVAPETLPVSASLASASSALALQVAPSGKSSAPDAPAPAPAQARRIAQAGGTSNAQARPELLLLELSINGRRLADAVRVEQLPGGVMLIPTDAWAGARLAPLASARALSDGTPAYALDALTGATFKLNRSNLSLEINAPATAFIGSSVGLQGELAVAPPRPDPGVMLNYDASLERSAVGGKLTGGATVEAVAFSSLGNFVSSALVRNDGVKTTATRLDSFWRYDMPERMQTLVIGDTVGVAGGWSRPARYGGVRWGRNFGMSPGFITMPQISLAGEAALPSTVEVLVNNARRASQQVQPGPFELTNVPIVTGAGQLNLVVRDLLGRETVIQQSYYASPRLLAPGLTDFSLEAGRLRTGYGVDGRYGDAFAAGTLRRGLTQSLTGEARVELQGQRRAAGVEVAGLLGNWAVGRVAVATSSGTSQGPAESGQLLQLGIERSTTSGGGAIQYEHTTRGFAPFGEATGPLVASLRARDRLLVSAGGSLWGPVSGGASFVRQTRWDGDQLTSLGLSLSMPVFQRASLSLSATRRLDGNHAWSAGVALNIPLDDGIQISSRVDRSTDGKLVGGVSAAKIAPAGPGLGWRVDASTQESQRARAGLQYNTSQIEGAVEIASDSQGHLASRASVRGTLGMLGGVPFASRPVGQGSFAVVEVPGMAGVPIKRSHQIVAETDSRGLAFIPGLLPWQVNQIEIDPTDLPLDTEVGNPVQEVTPYAGSGSTIRFAVRRTLQALVVILQPDGQPVPLGARVRLVPNGGEFIVGRRGEVWLTDLSEDRQRLVVTWPGGVTFT